PGHCPGRSSEHGSPRSLSLQKPATRPRTSRGEARPPPFFVALPSHARFSGGGENCPAVASALRANGQAGGFRCPSLIPPRSVQGRLGSPPKYLAALHAP